MRIETRKVERRLAALMREGRRLRKEDLTADDLAALLADIDADYANRTGGVSQNLWDFAHENFKDEIDGQRQKHFAQQARAKKQREKLGAETVSANDAGKSWAPVGIAWLKARAFEVNGEMRYPLDLAFWKEDFAKLVEEANAQSLPLDDPQNITAIMKNQMLAGEVHAVDLMSGQTLTSFDLQHYELIGELLKPTEQRRDLRSAQEFEATDSSLVAERERINTELLLRDLSAEFGKFAKTCPEFNDTEENRSKILAYCRANDLQLRQEGMRRAFYALYESGEIGRIPSVRIQTEVTIGITHPDPWRDESDEAEDFRRAVGKMSSDEYNAALENRDFREKADKWL